MRFGTTSILFVVAAFIFFCIWAVSSLLLTEVGDAIDAIDDDITDSAYLDVKTIIPTAFGIIAAIFFVSAILLAFILDSLSDETEYYWREP